MSTDQPHMEGAASGQGRVYQAGRDLSVQETVLPAEALRPVEQVEARPGLVNVPWHTQVFVGRGDELAELDRALAGGDPGPVVVAAVHGLGGVGKSTLAAEYAAAHAGAFNPVWWVTADSAAGVQAGLAALGAALQPELTRALPLEALAERARGWLATHDGWLLVLDNVSDPADIAPLLARTLGGRVVVTSRLGEGWHRLGARTVRLDVLTENQAVDLLTRVATEGRPGAELEGTAELVRELGCLPLAIEQAAGYLRQTHLTPRGYTGLLADQPAVMFDQAAEGADAERTVARVWRLTLDQLDGTPLAGQILRILAWYGAEAIPRSLLGAFRRPGSNQRSLLRRLTGRAAADGEPVDPAEIAGALGRLAAYNMITMDGGSVTVHRLVQAVARTPDPADPHRRPGDIAAARDQATWLLDETRRPFDVQDPAAWPTWRALLPHIDALIDHAEPHTDTTTTDHLLSAAGLFLHGQGSTNRAIGYLQRSLTAAQRLHGDDHPDTLTSCNNLANAYEFAGDLGRAIPLHRQTLADRARVLGRNHRDTLASTNNLAYAYYSAGDLDRAIPLYEQAITGLERVMGDDHPDTLAARSNLGSAYRAVGDMDRAIPLHERTLAASERVIGDDHPNTLAARNNLAYTYQEAGDLGRAIPLHERTLADRERVLGADHPDTLASRNNLAGAYLAASDLDKAVPLYEQTLADTERVMGADHPDTLASRNNLAGAYQDTGDVGRAVSLHEQTLADRARVLGDEHPQTLTSRNNLAYAYHSAGDLGRAITLYEQALADSERVLGSGHPLTRTMRDNLEAVRELSAEQPPPETG